MARSRIDSQRSPNNYERQERERNVIKRRHRENSKIKDRQKSMQQRSADNLY